MSDDRQECLSSTENIMSEAQMVAAIFGGLLAVLFIVAIMHGRAKERRRREDIQQWAFRNAYNYIQGPMPARELAPVKYFDTGDASNIARGSRMAIMDLRRTTTSTRGDSNT